MSVKVLVTGATGKVGNAIAAALLERGDQVRALVRDPERAAEVLPSGVEPVRGDATEPGIPAARGRGLRARLQRDGPARAVVRRRGDLRPGERGRQRRSRARGGEAAGVRRFIHTSTNDVFHADQGASFDESEVADYPKGTAYERSKQHAEELVLASAAARWRS